MSTIDIPIVYNDEGDGYMTKVARIGDDHLRQIRDGIAALPTCKKSLQVAGETAQPGIPNANTGDPVLDDHLAKPWPEADADHMAKAVMEDAQPDADEAAVKALVDIYKNGPGENMREGMQDILAAIRRGEAPGIGETATWYAKGFNDGRSANFEGCNQAAYAEIATLRARVAELEDDLNQARTDYNYIANNRDSHARCRREAEDMRTKIAELEGKLAVATADSVRFGTERVSCSMVLKNSLMVWRNEAQAANDRLAAQVAELTLERDQWKKDEKKAAEERDKALAELAAELEKSADYHRKALDLADHRDRLKDQLAAELERREKAEHRIGLFKNECIGVHKERDAANQSAREARAEAAAAKKRADKPAALLKSLRLKMLDSRPMGLDERMTVINRIDAALAGGGGKEKK